MHAPQSCSVENMVSNNANEKNILILTKSKPMRCRRRAAAECWTKSDALLAANAPTSRRCNIFIKLFIFSILTALPMKRNVNVRATRPPWPLVRLTEMNGMNFYDTFSCWTSTRLLSNAACVLFYFNFHDGDSGIFVSSQNATRFNIFARLNLVYCYYVFSGLLFNFVFFFSHWTYALCDASGRHEY